VHHSVCCQCRSPGTSPASPAIRLQDKTNTGICKLPICCCFCTRCCGTVLRQANAVAARGHVCLTQFSALAALSETSASAILQPVVLQFHAGAANTRSGRTFSMTCWVLLQLPACCCCHLCCCVLVLLR
jgi:hypothetical protein